MGLENFRGLAAYKLNQLFHNQLSEIRNPRTIIATYQGFLKLSEALLKSESKKDFRIMVIQLELWQQHMEEAEDSNDENDLKKLAKAVGYLENEPPIPIKKNNITIKQFNDLNDQFITPAAEIFHKLNDKFASKKFNSLFENEEQKRSIKKFTESMTKSFANAKKYLDHYIRTDTHGLSSYRQLPGPNKDAKIIPFPVPDRGIER